MLAGHLTCHALLIHGTAIQLFLRMHMNSIIDHCNQDATYLMPMCPEPWNDTQHNQSVNTASLHATDIHSPPSSPPDWWHAERSRAAQGAQQVQHATGPAGQQGSCHPSSMIAMALLVGVLVMLVLQLHQGCVPPAQYQGHATARLAPAPAITTSLLHMQQASIESTCSHCMLHTVCGRCIHKH